MTKKVDLKKCYKNKAKNEKQDGFPIEMTYEEFEAAWLEDPKFLRKKYKANSTDRSAYSMARIDYSKPLSKDNYQILPFKDVLKVTSQIKTNRKLFIE